jgi:hypothetical protein
MALNVIYSDIESERRPVKVGNNVAPGKPLVVGGRPAVTITGSGDYAGGLTSTGNASLDTMLGIGSHRGGVGLLDDHATVTFTGTYGFDVTGATAATNGGTTVYITNGGVLTLTAGSNTKFGVVEFFRGETSDKDTAVTIGINLG